MSAVTSLGNIFNTNSGSKAVTATPAVGDLIVIIAAHSGNTSAATPTDNNGGGGLYTKIASSVKASSADTLSVFIRNSMIESASSTTFTHNPGTSSGGGIVVLKVTGMTLVGLKAALQSALQNNQSSGGTPTPVFSNAVNTGHPVIAAVFNATSPATMTPRASPAYSERADVGYSTPTTGLEVMTIDSGETGTSIAWGGTSGSAFCSIAIELDTDNAYASIVGRKSESFSTSPGETISYTFPAGYSNTALLVSIVGYSPTAGNRPVTATWNGVSMTAIDNEDPGGDSSNAIHFYLPNPATGAHSLVITFAGTMDNFSYEIYALANATQSTPTNIAKSASLGHASPFSLSITTANNKSLVVGVQDIGTNSAYTNGQTSLDSYFTGFHRHGFIYRTTAGAYSWDETSDASGDGVIILVEIPPFVAGGSSIKTINGLAKASVKTVNALAVASIKSLNGLQ